MRLLNLVLPLVVGIILSLFTSGVTARSQAPNAIRRVSSLDQPTIKAPSRTTNRVDHLSHFDITFTIRDKEQRVKLELEPNHEILADDAYVQYLGEDGKVHSEEPIKRDRHKVFKGRALVGKGKAQGSWEPAGWTRIYVKEDGPRPLFEGVFNIRGDNHHILLQSSYLSKKRPQDVDIPRQDEEYMVFYRDSDTLRPADYSTHTDLKRSLPDESDVEPRWATGSTCNADNLGFNSDPNHPVLNSFTEKDSSRWASMPIADLFGFGLSKRQDDIGTVSGNGGGVNLESTIGDTSGCPSTMRVALIGIATDCSFWEKYDGRDDVQETVVSMVNSASNVFEDSFNISLGLRNLTITDKTCTDNPSSAAQWNTPCTQGNITSRLDLFSEWRGQQSDTNAYWTLMTDCNTGSEVGLAWLGQLCNNEVTDNGGSSVSGANVVVSTGAAGWQIFAHESGHTFGAVHDCTSQTCSQNLQDSSNCCPLSTSTCDAGGDYIMNPSTGQDITKFSQCTIGNICAALGRNSVKSNCLSDNRGIETFTGAQCGNGIVESGEDCDCGGEESCGDNQCCDPSTCKYKDGATCDDANDGCCISCQFASADYICRPSTGECDLEEKCTGNSSTCPTDSWLDDGDDCGDSGSGLQCASGQCTSRDAQCESYMGSVTGSNNTRSCDQDQFPVCQMWCRDETSSSFMTTQCVGNSQNYLDGTPCNNGGRCKNGTCQGSKSWIEAHKNIIIPVVAGVGGLIVIAILISCLRRCRKSRYTMKPVPPVPTSYAAWPRGPPPPQQTQMRRLTRSPGPGYGQVPPGPPPQGPYPSPYGPYPGPGAPRGPIPAPYPGHPDGPPPGYTPTPRYA
ncbi:Metallo-peptidase family M12-domain-containing protein [Aspergillus venezuelensis]